MDKELNKRMMSWISGNNTGVSSITLWSTIMNIDNYSPSIPYDVYDFQRCYNLLKLCNETTKNITLNKVAERYNIWKPFVRHWNELTNFYEKGNMKDFNKLLTELRKRYET